jgi:hypothetical protein
MNDANFQALVCEACMARWFAVLHVATVETRGSRHSR